MAIILSLATLTIIHTMTQFAQLPINPVLALGAPFSNAHIAGAILENRSEGWRTYALQENWFDQGLLKTIYLVAPTGLLQSIQVSATNCLLLAQKMEKTFGRPLKQGTSPSFLNSIYFFRWETEGVAFVLEDFSPGCELMIYRLGAAMHE
jgi:hypothetical protein